MNIRTIILFALINLTVACGGGGSTEPTPNTQVPDTPNVSPTEPPVTVEKIVANDLAYAAIKSDGKVATWGTDAWGGSSVDVQHLLTDVIEIYSTDGAFAALKADGTVVTWGSSNYGGDSTNVSSELYDIKEIVPSGLSFAALRKDGVVVSWGADALPRIVTDVNRLIASSSSFSVIKKDGSIAYWDNSAYEEINATASEVTSLIACDSDAFAAILTSGEVITWGNSYITENFPALGLVNVKEVYGTGWGFLAVLDDGTTEYWGIKSHASLGENPPANLVDVKSVKSSGYSKSIALTSAGSIVSWGYYGEKTDGDLAKNWEKYSDYPKSLTNIKTIYGFSATPFSPEAFAAFDTQGNLYLWGGKDLPESPIKNVETVVGTSSAIAVLKHDKTVEYWGNVSVEIDPTTLKPKVKPLLVNISSIYASSVGFSAIREDGTVITWGNLINNGKVDFGS